MVINSLLVFLILLTVGGTIFLRYQRTADKGGEARYVERPVLDKSDAIMFGRLCRALPNCYIFPHLSLAAIIEPAEGNRKRNPEHFNRLINLTVDFAIFNADLGLVCVVCMDQSALNQEDAPESDPSRVALETRRDQGGCVIAPRTSFFGGTDCAGHHADVARGDQTQAGKPVTTISPNTVQRIYSDDPVPARDPGVINGLTAGQLDKLTPNKVLSKSFPHIWQRVCLFAPEPVHLQKYLVSAIDPGSVARSGPAFLSKL